MKVEVQVPVRNAEGKHLTLKADTETGEVEMVSPVMFKAPKVHIDDLRGNVNELFQMVMARDGDGE